MPAMPTMQCNHYPSFSNSRLGIMHAASPSEDASEMEGGHATSNRARGSICISSGQGKEKKKHVGSRRACGVGVAAANCTYALDAGSGGRQRQTQEGHPGSDIDELASWQRRAHGPLGSTRVLELGSGSITMARPCSRKCRSLGPPWRLNSPWGVWGRAPLLIL